MSDSTTNPPAIPTIDAILEHSFRNLLDFSPDTEGGQQIRHWANYQDIRNLDSFFHHLKFVDFQVGRDTMGYSLKPKKNVICLKQVYVNWLESLWTYLHIKGPDSVSVFDEHGKTKTFYEAAG